MNSTPFFSIITVTYNDAWSLMKTARSVFEQSFENLEYIIVDGGSQDGSAALINFWKTQGLADQGVSEKDGGVYDAMNKGMRMASGRYVCFLNSSDVFADKDVLDRVHKVLSSDEYDGVLGWGELNGQIWASWIESEAFKMASLGFCHQSLYLRRELLLQHPFDDRSNKTDSDTLQLGSIYASGAKVPIMAEVLAKRGGEPGISAHLERTKISILDTLLKEYPSLSEQNAGDVIDFRRRCEGGEKVAALLAHPDKRLAHHLAIMVLDTLFQRASKNLPQEVATRLMRISLDVLGAATNTEQAHNITRLIDCQNLRAQKLVAAAEVRRDLDRAVTKFEDEENRRIEKIHTAGTISENTERSDFVISLTTFPARIKTVHFAIRSLFEQTRPPKEIHLWLGRDEIPGPNWLPSRLRELQPLGLRIHFCDRTHHQYDKFLHNAELNADAPFVIVDDDVIYPPQALERLLEGHQMHPEAVIGNRCHWIAMTEDGTVAPYMKWQREARLDRPSFRLMPTGAGGVLYPKGFFTDPIVTDIDKILSHAPYADDVWLKVCALARQIPTFATALSHKSDWYHRYTPTMKEGTLMAANVERGLNDKQIELCLDWLNHVSPNWKTNLQLGDCLE